MVVGLGEWASRTVTAATQRFHETRQQTLSVAAEKAAARLGEIDLEDRTLGLEDILGTRGRFGEFRVGQVPQPIVPDNLTVDSPAVSEAAEALIDQFRERNTLSRTPFTPTPTFLDRVESGVPGQVPLPFADPARAEASLGGRPIIDPSGDIDQLFEDAYLRELGGRLRRGMDFDTASDQALQAAISIFGPPATSRRTTTLGETVTPEGRLALTRGENLRREHITAPGTTSDVVGQQPVALERLERLAERFLDPSAASFLQGIESPSGNVISGVSGLKAIQREAGPASRELGAISDVLPEGTEAQRLVGGVTTLADIGSAVLPRDKTFEEVKLASKGKPPTLRPGERPDTFLRRLEVWKNKTSGFVDPFAAAFGNDEEIGKGEGVLEEAGFGRALAVQIIADPFNALPGLGFTKIEHIGKFASLVIKAAKASPKARTALVTALRESKLAQTALRNVDNFSEAGFFRLEGDLPPIESLDASLAKAQERVNVLDTQIQTRAGKKGVKLLRDERVVAGADLARLKAQREIYDVTNGDILPEEQLERISALKDDEAGNIMELERLNLKAEALQDRGAPQPQFGSEFDQAMRDRRIGTTRAEQDRIASERIERKAAREGAADSTARWEAYRDFLRDPSYVEAEAGPIGAGRMDLTEFIDETGKPSVRAKSGDVVERPTFEGENVRLETQEDLGLKFQEAVPEGQAALPADVIAEREADRLTVAHADARPTRIMNLDVKIEKSQRVGGVDYELYRATKPGQDGAVIRLVDDSGNIVSTDRHPTFAGADAEYVKATEAARLADSPAARAAEAAPAPGAAPTGGTFTRGNRVNTPAGPGTVRGSGVFDGVREHFVQLDSVPEGATGGTPRFKPEELTPIGEAPTPTAPVRGIPEATKPLPVTPPRGQAADKFRKRYERARTDATKKKIEDEWVQAHGLEKVPIGSGYGHTTAVGIDAAPRQQINEIIGRLRRPAGEEAVAPTGATVPKSKLRAPEAPKPDDVVPDPPPPEILDEAAEEAVIASPITAGPRRAIAAPTGRGQIVPPPATRALAKISVEEGDIAGESIFRSPEVMDKLARDSSTTLPRVSHVPPRRAATLPESDPLRLGLDNVDEVFADVKAAAQNHRRAVDQARAAADGRPPPIDPPNPPGGFGAAAPGAPGGPGGPGVRPPRPFGEFPELSPDLPAGRVREIVDDTNEVYRHRVLESNSQNSAIGDAMEARDRDLFTFDGAGNFTDATIESAPPGRSLEFHDVIQRRHDYVWRDPEAKKHALDLADRVEQKTLEAEAAGIVVRRAKRPADEVYFPRTATEIEGERIPGAAKPRRGIGARQQHELPRVNEFAETTRGNGVDLLNSPAREVEVYLKGVDRTIIDAEYARIIQKLGKTPAQRIARVFKEAVIATTRKRNAARAVVNKLRKAAISRSPERAPNVNALRSFKKRLDTRLVNARINEAKVTTPKAKARWRSVQRALGDEVKDAQRRIDDAIAEGRGGLKGRIKGAEDQLSLAENQLKKAKAERARQIDIARRPRGKQEALIREPFASTRVFPRETARAVERGFQPGTPAAVTKVLEASNEISNIFRPLWAAGDLSAIGLQTATGAVMNPAGYVKTYSVVLSSLADPGNYFRYVDANADVIAEAISRGMPWGGHEFSFEDALAGPLGDVVEKVIRRTGLKMGNDAFTRSINVMTLELYKQGRAIALDIGEGNMSKLTRQFFGPVAKGEDGLTQVAAVVANLSGRMSLPAAAKLGPTQALFLRALPFAGRYYTAWASLVGKAVVSHGLDGNIARRALLSFAGGLGGAYWLTGKAIGQEPHWELDGKFMTYSLAGQNIGPGGIMYGFIRLGGQIADDPGNAAAIGARWARGRASPTVSILSDVLSGTTFTYDKLDSPGAIAEYIAKLPLPFAAQSALEVTLEGEGPIGVATTFGAEFIGGRAFPRSPFQDRDDGVAKWAEANNIKDDDDNTPTKYRNLNRAQRSAWKETDEGVDLQEDVIKASKNFNETSQESFEAIADVRERLVSDPETAEIFGLTTTQDQDNSLLKRGEIDGRDWRERLSDRLDKLRTIRSFTEDPGVRKRLGIDFEIKPPDAGSVDAMLDAYFDVVPGNFADDKGEIDWDAYFTAKDGAFSRAVQKGGPLVKDFLRPFEEDAVMRDFRKAKDLRSQVETIPKYQRLSVEQGDILDEFLDEASDLIDRWFRESKRTFSLVRAIKALADFNAEKEGPKHESGWSWENIKGWAILLRPGSSGRTRYSDPARDNFISDPRNEVLLTFFPELSRQLSRPQIATLPERQFETALTQR